MTPTTMSTMKKTHLSSEKSVEKKPAPGMLLRDGGFCTQSIVSPWNARLINMKELTY